MSLRTEEPETVDLSVSALAPVYGDSWVLQYEAHASSDMAVFRCRGAYMAVMVIISVQRFIAYFRWKDSR